MSSLQMALLVGAGGFVGSVLRFLVARMVEMPWGTLLVNVTGSLLIGVLMGIFAKGGMENWRLLIVVGLLGGYTTFSAFSYETVTLIAEGATTKATVYVLTSVMASVLATWAGLAASKTLVS